MQVLAGSLEVPPRGEIADVDDQRIGLPPAARVPPRMADGRRKMRPPVYRDDTVPPLSLTRVVENRHRSRRLHDLTEPAEIWQDGCHTTFRISSIFWAVGPIDVATAGKKVARWVLRQRLQSPR